jgi:hypothetical protein
MRYGGQALLDGEGVKQSPLLLAANCLTNH